MRCNARHQTWMLGLAVGGVWLRSGLYEYVPLHIMPCRSLDQHWSDILNMTTTISPSAQPTCCTLTEHRPSRNSTRGRPSGRATVPIDLKRHLGSTKWPRSSPHSGNDTRDGDIPSPGMRGIHGDKWAQAVSRNGPLLALHIYLVLGEQKAIRDSRLLHAHQQAANLASWPMARCKSPLLTDVLCKHLTRTPRGTSGIPGRWRRCDHRPPPTPQTTPQRGRE